MSAPKRFIFFVISGIVVAGGLWIVYRLESPRPQTPEVQIQEAKDALKGRDYRAAQDLAARIDSGAFFAEAREVEKEARRLLLAQRYVGYLSQAQTNFASERYWPAMEAAEKIPTDAPEYAEAQKIYRNAKRLLVPAELKSIREIAKQSGPEHALSMLAAEPDIVQNAHEANALRRQLGREPRKAWAKQMEGRLLSEYIDMEVRAIGEMNETLFLKSAIIDRPFVHNFVAGEDVQTNLQTRGFRRVVFEGAFDRQWTYELPQ